MTNKQKPREDGWYYRVDGPFPFQNWCPFDDPDARVEVKNSTTGLSRVDFVKNVWWGHTAGIERETVVNYARLAEPLELDEEKVTAAEALRRHVATRHGTKTALRVLDDPETEVFIDVYYKNSAQRLKVPAAVKDQSRRLLVAIESESRENFIKEYVDV